MSMKPFVVAAALALAAPSASAQDTPFPRNPNIDIAYARPTDVRFALIHDRMRQLEVLETLQEFLSPLKLPRKITVRMACQRERLSAMHASYCSRATDWIAPRTTSAP